jgi:hypothetical protein
MHTFMRGALLAAALPLVAACSSLVTGGDLIRPGEATGIIEVINGTSNDLHAVLISECNASTYGLNRMGSGEVIRPGESRQFTVSAGCWDVDAGTLGVGEARQRMTVPANAIQPYRITG